MLSFNTPSARQAQHPQHPHGRESPDPLLPGPPVSRLQSPCTDQIEHAPDIGAVVGCQPHIHPTIVRRGQLRGGQLRILQDRLKPL